ncbi:hypothetical protein T07_6445 [Trichinella nelsoni]|uniref:Uncharacterized protein n=1 Tax=Trichinella nelsoni TaxID=6336 RepID=A0A0V0RWD6_9BILA|nr:hypothetical protein T07_6445 [Trichinella nelsoni]
MEKSTETISKNLNEPENVVRVCASKTRNPCDRTDGKSVSPVTEEGSEVSKRQEGMQRLNIHEPGCDICAQADPSHGSMPGGSALDCDEEASAVSAEPSTSGYFPVFKWVKSTMYSQRSKRFPKMPEHRQDLQIPDAFRTKVADEDLLLWQSASRHIVVFATGKNIRLLGKTKTWGMDGTFKVVPEWYQQLFVISAFLAGKLVPAVYCLCTEMSLTGSDNDGLLDILNDSLEESDIGSASDSDYVEKRDHDSSSEF